MTSKTEAAGRGSKSGERKFHTRAGGEENEKFFRANELVMIVAALLLLLFRGNLVEIKGRLFEAKLIM